MKKLNQIEKLNAELKQLNIALKALKKLDPSLSNIHSSKCLIEIEIKTVESILIKSGVAE